MYLSLTLILEQLMLDPYFKAASPRLFAENPKLKLNRMALLPVSDSDMAKETLWCGNLFHVLKMEPEQRKDFCFLLTGTKEQFELLEKDGTGNYILFDSQVGNANLFNRTQDIFSKFITWEHRIDLSIAQQADLQELLDITNNIFPNLIMFWNASFDVIAYSRNRSMPEKIEKIIKAGHFPGDAVSTFVEMGYMTNESFNKLNTNCPPNWAGVPWSVHTFKEGEKSLFTMAAYHVDSPPSEGILEILEAIDAKIEKYIYSRYTTGIRQKNYLYESFLSDLIDRKITQEEEIKDRLKYLSIPYFAHFRLYQLKFESFSDSLASFARNNCKVIFPFAKVIIHNQHLYVIDIEQEETRKPSSFKDKRFLSLLSSSNCVCGVSGEFENLSEMSMAAVQSMHAFKIGASLFPDSRIFFWPELRFFDLIYTYEDATGIGLDHLYLKSLNRIIENDIKTGNNNLKLLEIFLNRDRNITQTAKEMNLHRNSVIYRIERIEKMLEASLDDYKVRNEIIMSLAVLKFMDAVKEKPIN